VDGKPKTYFSLAREVGGMADFYDPALSVGTVLKFIVLICAFAD
jgi:hypothetical protein